MLGRSSAWPAAAPPGLGGPSAMSRGWEPLRGGREPTYGFPPASSLRGQGVSAMIGRSSHGATAEVRLLSRLLPAGLLLKGRRPGLRPMRRLLLLAARLCRQAGLRRRLVGVHRLQDALPGVEGRRFIPPGWQGPGPPVEPRSPGGRTAGGRTSPKINAQSPLLGCF